MSQYVFAVDKDGITWNQAAAAAQQRGGQLASVNSPAEDAFIRAVLANNDRLWNYDPRDGAANGPWIGLVQKLGSAEPDGGWSWLDGSEFTPFGWHPVEPDNFLGDSFGHYWSYQGAIGWGDHVDDPIDAGYGAVTSYVVEIADGIPRLTGTRAGELFYGGEIANVIDARGGADVLDGGGGADVLSGGAGKDRFVFTSAVAADGDSMTDVAANETIDLSGIDANENRAGEQRFKIVAEFTGRAGQLVIAFDGANSTLSGDTDGDGVADMVVRANGDLRIFDGLLL